ALKRQLAEHAGILPRDLPTALAVSDVGPLAPPTRVPPNGPVVEPGFPVVLGGEKAAPRATETSTGRRTALARWITRPDHPLTPRVMVNRLWQQHFGRGLVATASDFGRLGEKPSHPELLDWLAREFVKSGWSIKAMHRLMTTSAVYRQSSVHPEAAKARLKDPDARLLWRMPLRRLEGEEIRDAMLAVGGELDLATGGPSVDPNQPRRTVFTKAVRNMRDPILDAFDPPDAFASVAQRNTTTTATQSLLLINGRWPLERAAAFARRLKGLPTAEQVDLAWRLATGRPPSPSERAAATAFLERGAAVAARPADMPLVQAMPDRGSQAARIRGAEVLDRLKLPSPSPICDGDFTIEAVVVLDSLHEDAAVRTIASQWNGNPKSRGWSLGVTSEKSKHLPRNLILQLVGDAGYEVVASDLRLDLHRTHYVAVSVRLADTGPRAITFYLQDLSDPEAPLRVANVRHAVTSGVTPTAALVIGGRDGPTGHGWDGLIDEIRISRAALAKEQLLLFDGVPPPGAVAAHWRFEVEPGFFQDSAGVQPNLTRPSAPASATPAASEASLVDFCHALLNSNGFLYVD
ncbi:MAG TPA: DUF1553 domain-containing protein, partial [Planctomycetota bacterium]|nr:DUF1553 domain-containing protein [Planctomycetota bacterium]